MAEQQKMLEVMHLRVRNSDHTACGRLRGEVKATYFLSRVECDNCKAVAQRQADRIGHENVRGLGTYIRDVSPEQGESI